MVQNHDMCTYIVVLFTLVAEIFTTFASTTIEQ